MMVTYVCRHCGGPNIKCDAWARWSDDDQRWELAQTFDQTICDDCDRETSARECPLDIERSPVVSD